MHFSRCCELSWSGSWSDQWWSGLYLGFYADLKWTFSDNLTIYLEKFRRSWCGNGELTLVLSFHMASAALKSHAGCLYPSFYTGKNSRQ